MIVAKGSTTTPQRKPAKRAAKPSAQASIDCKLTHAQLCERARTWLLGTGRCSMAFVEFATNLSDIPDAIGFRAAGRESILVECKASRSDFLADRKKASRHPDAPLALGTWRFFMCEPGVIKPEDLAARWGLLYVEAKCIRVIVGPNVKAHWTHGEDPWRWPSTGGELVVLHSALRRLQIELGADRFRSLSQKTLTDKEAEQNDPNHWSAVLGCSRLASTSEIRVAKDAARDAARIENGGTVGQMDRVAKAWQQVCIEHGIPE